MVRSSLIERNAGKIKREDLKQVLNCKEVAAILWFGLPSRGLHPTRWLSPSVNRALNRRRRHTTTVFSCVWETHFMPWNIGFFNGGLSYLLFSKFCRKL